MSQAIDTTNIRDAIYGRCSVRAYAPERIDEPMLRALLAAAALNLPDIKHDLGISPEITSIAPIIVGRPRGEALPSARNEPQIVARR